MTDRSRHNATVNFRIKISKVVILTEADGTNPATYRLSYTVEGINDVGAGETIIEGYILADFIGSMYSIIAVGSGTLDIEDSFRTGECPCSNNNAIIAKTVWSGRAPMIAPYNLKFLHQCAAERINQWNLDLLWSNDPNALRIPFTATDTPSIIGYQSPQTIEGIIYNLAEDYGENPKCRLMENSEGIVRQRTELPYFTFELSDSGLIDSISFGSLDIEITGYIEISK